MKFRVLSNNAVEVHVQAQHVDVILTLDPEVALEHAEMLRKCAVQAIARRKAHHRRLRRMLESVDAD